MKHVLLRKLFTSCICVALRDCIHDRNIFIWNYLTRLFRYQLKPKRWRQSGESGSKFRDTVLFWGYDETKRLLDIWADEEIQRQLSAIGRKQNTVKPACKNLWFKNLQAEIWHQLNTPKYKNLLSLAKKNRFLVKKSFQFWLSKFQIWIVWETSVKQLLCALIYREIVTWFLS